MEVLWLSLLAAIMGGRLGWEAVKALLGSSAFCARLEVAWRAFQAATVRP